MGRLWIAGVAGPSTFVVVFVVEGAVRPDYDPMRLPVSLLSLTDRGIVTAASFVAAGLLLVLFAVGLRRALQSGMSSSASPGAMAAAGLGLVLAGVFPTDPSFGYPPGAPATLPDVISLGAYVHVVGAMLLFLGLAAAALTLARRFWREGKRAWAFYSVMSGVAVVVLFGLSSAGPSGDFLIPPIAGLLQRASLIVGMGWTAALAWSYRGRLNVGVPQRA